MTNEAERRAIRDLWPAHIEHLPPETNRLGQPYTDTEHGIVCNCGDVLGWPKDVPTPVEVVANGTHTEQAVAIPDEAVPSATGGWVMEHGYDATSDPSAMAVASPDTLGEADPEFFDYVDRHLSGDDSADEAQATLGGRAVRDIQLPPGTALEPASSEDAWPPRDSGGPEGPPDFAGKLPARPTDVMIPADPLDTRVTVIDPSLPYGPEQVEHQLIRIEGQLERGIHFQRYWEERLHYAKVAFELANARALIRADGGDAATRKAQALLACEAEYVELQVCETMVRSARECMHSLRSLQTGYQTISNSVGATYRSRPSGA